MCQAPGLVLLAVTGRDRNGDDGTSVDVEEWVCVRTHICVRVCVGCVRVDGPVSLEWIIKHRVWQHRDLQLLLWPTVLLWQLSL